MRHLEQPGTTLPSLVFTQYEGDRVLFTRFIQHLKADSEGRYFATVAIVNHKAELEQCVGLVDDVLVRPFNPTQAEYKLNTHLRCLRLFRELANERDGLEIYQKNVCVEQELVNKMFAVQCESQLVSFDNVRCQYSAEAMFHGSFLLIQQGPTGSIYILLADADGTGLPATMASNPLFSVFRAMAQKGLPPGSIAAELNRVLPSSVPDGMLVGAVVAELNNSADQLTVWSGGMPEGVIINADGQLQAAITSVHAPLVAKEEFDFCQDVDVYSVAKGNRFLLVTSSLERSTNYDKVVFGHNRFLQLFNGNHNDCFEALLQSHQGFTEGAPQLADIAVVEVLCDADEMPALKTQTKSTRPIPWQLNVELTTDDLRSVSPVPQIAKLLSNAVGLDVHQDFISTILSELYNNALEHGVLGLSSEMKQSEDGFLEYYMQRESRLAELNEGWVNIAISLDQGKVVLSVHDSGPGFDYHSLTQASEENAFGRGMSIINSVCDSYHYSHGGAKVTVHYSVSE